MPFMPAERSRIMVGSLNLSAYGTRMSAESKADMHDVTPFSDAAGADSKSKVYIPGQDSSTFSVSGNLDVDASSGGQVSVLTAWKSTADLALTYAPSGLAFGSECWLAAANLTEYSTESSHDDAVKFSIDAQTDGPADAGAVLENFTTAITVDGNGTARDNGAATSNGGVAHLHVTAFSGFTNNIVTIEHSVDGATAWATLVTFTTYTGVTSERVVVAAGTTVRRYLRVVDNVTGTGSTTRAVAFSRR